MIKGWNRFWFEFDHPWALALARVQVAGTMLWLYSIRQFSNLQSFAEDGMVPRKLALPLMMEAYRPPFAWFELWPDAWNFGVHAFFLFCLLMVFLGAGVRFWGVLAWILHMGFLQRNYSILFGADIILAISLFYLMMTRCEDRLSLRALWRGQTPVFTSDLLSSVGARLWMLQLGILYAYTGMEKLKGSSWWDGTALWTVLGNPQMVITDLAFLRHMPFVIVSLSFMTILFEIYFPAAMLSRRLRPGWLAAGVAFHLGIAFLMDLWTFSLGMLAGYWLFLDRVWLEALIQRLKQRWFPQKT